MNSMINRGHWAVRGAGVILLIMFFAAPVIETWLGSFSAFRIFTFGFESEEFSQFWYVIVTGLAPLFLILLGSKFKASAAFSVIGLVLQIVVIALISDMLGFGFARISGAVYVPIFAYVAVFIFCIICVRQEKKAEKIEMDRIMAESQAKREARRG